ncbi:hypothetical protein MHYP_G00010130, partial [Metynnis hypsauchen]
MVPRSIAGWLPRMCWILVLLQTSMLAVRIGQHPDLEDTFSDSFPVLLWCVEVPVPSVHACLVPPRLWCCALLSIGWSWSWSSPHQASSVPFVGGVMPAVSGAPVLPAPVTQGELLPTNSNSHSAPDSSITDH